MRISRLRNPTHALGVVMVELLALYLVLLVMPFGGALYGRWNSGRDLWLFITLEAVAVAVIVIRAVQVREDRAAWVCFAAAAACWSAGSIYFLLVVRVNAPVVGPTVADIGFLAFLPLVWCGIALLLRGHRGPVDAGVWLDGLLGALASAAAATVVFPLIVATTGDLLASVATEAIYPVGDLVLLAALTGAFAVFGWRPPRVWVLLGGGIVGFAVSDISFLLRIAAGTYASGGAWDTGWPIGLVLFALAARCPLSTKAQVRRVGWLPLVVPSACGMIGLGLLTYGSFTRLPKVTVILAAGCVLAGLARTAFMLRDLQSLGMARHEARTDDLTGLANRRQFYARLDHALNVPSPNRRLAVVLIDLDRFKQINDSLGHHVGDTLIQMVGQRLSGVLKSGDLLARLGGDEFAVIVADADRAAAGVVAKRLRDVLQDSFLLDELTLHIDASIGIAIVPDDGDDVVQLLQRADRAMYRAKSDGSGLASFSSDRDGGGADRLVTTGELRSALYDDQLVLHYQPKLTLATGAVTAVEALVRWQHPTRGLVPPDEFLPVAESAGLMPALTTVVLDQALRQCAAWRAEGLDLNVAVNISASDLLDTELPGLVQAMLTNLNLPASSLELEITETVLLSDNVRTITILQQLSSLGLRIAIDDYGTGFSSLAYLADLPVDVLKLDQSFIRTMDGEGLSARRATSIVTSTIALAKGLQLGFIAEGVETASSLAQLAALGCETIQGYFVSRPLPAAELAAWIVAREGALSVKSGYSGTVVT